MVRQTQHGNDGQERVEGRDTPSITSHYLSFCVAIISLHFQDFPLILPYPTFSSSSSFFFFFLVPDVQLLLCLTLCSPTDFSLQVWSGVLFPTPGDLPDPEIKSDPLMSLALAGRFFTTSDTIYF